MQHWIDNVLADPATSLWLRHALTTALERDAGDAAEDAGILYRLLSMRYDALLTEE